MDELIWGADVDGSAHPSLQEQAQRFEGAAGGRLFDKQQGWVWPADIISDMISCLALTSLPTGRRHVASSRPDAYEDLSARGRKHHPSAADRIGPLLAGLVRLDLLVLLAALCLRFRHWARARVGAPSMRPSSCSHVCFAAQNASWFYRLSLSRCTWFQNSLLAKIMPWRATTAWGDLPLDRESSCDAEAIGVLRELEHYEGLQFGQ